MRAKSLSSPSPNGSGKSSPCPSFSGKMSPCAIMEDAKLINSPRKKLLDIKTNIALTTKSLTADRCVKSPRLHATVKPSKSEAESNGLLMPVENGIANMDTELTKIPEESQQMSWGDLVEQDDSCKTVRSPSRAESMFEAEPCEGVQMCDQYSQTSGLTDEYLTLQQWRDKYENNSNKTATDDIHSTIELAVSHTTNKLDEMENVFLNKNTNQPSNLIETSIELSKDNKLNLRKLPNAADETKSAITESLDKKSALPEEKKVQTGAQLKYSNVVGRSTTATVAKKNDLQKVTSNRLHPMQNTKPLFNTVGKSSAAPNSIGIFSVVRRQPLKSASIAPISRTKVSSHKESVARDSDKRTVKAMVTRTCGVPSNTASRLAARSKTMIDLKKTTTTNPTIVKSGSRDSIGSSTSTLRASNDQISNVAKSNARRSEPRTIAVRNEDDDGWLTVKARRRSSFHWSNRFNQPSGYASLPTLALLNEKDTTKSCNKKENKKANKPTQSKAVEVETAKPKAVAVSTSSAISVKDKSTPSATKSASIESNKSKSKTQAADQTDSKIKLGTKEIEKQSSVVSRATILQRQRSDITGLKLNSLRKEYFRIEKIKRLKDSKKTSMTDEQSENQTMDIQVNDKMCLSSAMSELYTSCLEGESLNNEINKRDVESDDTEIESDENQRKLLEEQECLERQIFELQNTEIDVDTENDDAECDNILGLCKDETTTQLEQCDDDMNLEAKYHHLLSDMSMGERIQTLATLQAFVTRHPGRAQELHQKLSSPSHRSLTEILEKYQEKQERAKDVRESLTKEKTLKLQALLARVEDVKIAKQKLIDEKRMRMEEKLQRYAENRSQYIKCKVRKAHDEEEKLKEIVFIKSLEAQNKRLDLLELKKEQESRLQDLEAERQKRVEEKAAKEAAVERRRLELALERQKRLERMDETRREREQRVVSMQEEREKIRQQIARDKVKLNIHKFLVFKRKENRLLDYIQFLLKLKKNSN